MAPTSQLFILLYFFTNQFTVNALKHETHAREENVHKNAIKKLEYELGDTLDYPRGDKDKLRRISKLWSKYYACTKRLRRRVNAAGRLPSVSQAAFERAITKLRCGLCVAPGEDAAVKWIYSQTPKGPFSPLVSDERGMIATNGNLIIHDLKMEDAGTYRCTIGQSAGGAVVLDVVDKREPYDVVKPSTSYGPYPPSPIHFQYHGLSIQACLSWSPWSDCSECGQVGRRRKYGICYVKINSKDRYNKTHIRQKNGQEANSTMSKNLSKLFQDFPDGVSCRSRLLPINVRRLLIVEKRRNQIMVGFCKVPCEKDSVYEVRSSRGTLLERANNTSGVYSLSQLIPREPPMPASEIIFAAVGEPLILSCPGILLRDIPVNWRVGTKIILPIDVDISSGRLVHLNARDDLVFTTVRFEDSNLYSCWSRDELIGTVKLEVWNARPYWDTRVMLLAAVLAAACMLRAVDVLRGKHRGPQRK